MNLRSFWMRMTALFLSRRLDAELEAEIAAHLELAQKKAAERSLAPDEARGSPGGDSRNATAWIHRESW